MPEGAALSWPFPDIVIPALFLSKQVFVGLAGYAYQQITDDSGPNPKLGGFRSRVLGIGPQIGYVFPIGGMQGFWA